MNMKIFCIHFVELYLKLNLKGHSCFVLYISVCEGNDDFKLVEKPNLF